MATKVSNSPEYEVITDLPPDQLNMVGLEVFRTWMEFALGGMSLDQYRILSPTGRYASSLSFRNLGTNKVAIMADSSVAPEADILETGHDAFDMKKLVQLHGRTFPMHRGFLQNAPIAGRVRPRQSAKKIWAQVRSSGFNGYATMPTKITPENADSWIIPEMPAYAPAAVLAALVGTLYGA